MSYLLYPDGYKERAVPKNGAAFTIAELQDYVGGYIGVEEVEEGFLVFNEDAEDSVFNRPATDMVIGYNPNFQGIISGNAIVCARGQIRT